MEKELLYKKYYSRDQVSFMLGKSIPQTNYIMRKEKFKAYLIPGKNGQYFYKKEDIDNFMQNPKLVKR